MLIIKTNQPNTLVVTVSQNSELTNPVYLFSFTHIFSKQSVSFIPTNISTHPSRYNEFIFVEGTGVGQIRFPYQGQYTYAIYEQPTGSGNLNPALSEGLIETGVATLMAQTGMTTNDFYFEYVSNDEFNSNYIFAPNELNPPPPSPTTNRNSAFTGAVVERHPETASRHPLSASSTSIETQQEEPQKVSKFKQRMYGNDPY